VRKLKFLLPLAAVAIVAAPAHAQQTAAAGSLDDLLKQVQSVRADETQQFEKNRAAYNAAMPNQQTEMLNTATKNRNDLNTASTKLTDTYSANEIKINDANKQLRDKADKLGLTEVFGLSRQVANDVSSILQQSLITSQFPTQQGQVPRDEFLRNFANSKATPTASDLERVWLEVQREMTASGQVAKYMAAVVQPGGEPVQSEVIRIGPFTATSNGKFLSYLPNLRTLNVLPRQLPQRFMAINEKFEKATSGYVEAVVDSARGVLLALYVDRPRFLERIQLGQEVGYLIITVGLLGAAAFLFQLVTLLIVRRSVSSQLKHPDRPTANNPLGRVLLAFQGDKKDIEEDADVAELRITEAVLKEVPRLERFQAFLRLCVAAGPLLGLIGTVWGMILTFQSITETGSSDPKLMATGIGQAMIATVLGLGIAIPLLFANALLNSLSRGVVQILDEQSAGMLAESIEKQRRA
jgi:biopolymer transport protein ExbB